MKFLFARVLCAAVVAIVVQGAQNDKSVPDPQLERDMKAGQTRIDSYNQSEARRLERVSEPENKFLNEIIRGIGYQPDTILQFRGKLENQLSTDCIHPAKQRLDIITQTVKSAIYNCLSGATTLQIGRNCIRTEQEKGMNLMKIPFATASACGHIVAGNIVLSSITTLVVINKAIDTSTATPPAEIISGNVPILPIGGSSITQTIPIVSGTNPTASLTIPSFTAPSSTTPVLPASSLTIPRSNSVSATPINTIPAIAVPSLVSSFIPVDNSLVAAAIPLTNTGNNDLANITQ